MEKINIAELLKNCPKGMKLYSPIFGDVYLDKVRPHLAIVVTTDKYKEEFLYDGRYGMNGECMLFPSKGKTTWEGFVPPCDFKDGDVIYVKTKSFKWVSIFRRCDEKKIFTYTDYNLDNKDFYGGNDNLMMLCSDYSAVEKRFATEEEKQKLFDAIKENGYKWNPDTKTLEKLIEPKFKVGDKITNGKASITIGYIDNEHYYEISKNFANRLSIKNQDEWYLVPNKFDINTLKPFDKVLVRTKHFHDKWICGFFSHKDSQEFAPFWTTADKNYKQCIPYEGNEHLLGKTDECDEYYYI